MLRNLSWLHSCMPGMQRSSSRFQHCHHSEAKPHMREVQSTLVLLWHLPSPLGSPRSSRHSGNRRDSHLESQGLRNYLLSLARSLHKLQERGKKPIKKEWLWKTSGSTKPSAHGCCVQAGGWYSNSAHWPKVMDHLKPCQRGDVKFARISGIEDDQCKDRWNSY